MYHGNLVEFNNINEIFKNPQHDYTKSLLNAIPIQTLKVEKKERRKLNKD